MVEDKAETTPEELPHHLQEYIPKGRVLKLPPYVFLVVL